MSSIDILFLQEFVCIILELISINLEEGWGLKYVRCCNMV